MRMAAVIGVLAATAGCNQIFGLDPADPLPDAPDAAGTLPHVALTWQIAKTLQDGPDPMIEQAPIVPAPAVRIGRLDGPLGDVPYRSDGTIEIPEDFPGTVWRLEYTIDDVVHEVQWSPARDAGHVIVPLAGRLPREPVPAGGGYQITPTGGATTHPNARVYTTGVWTDGNATSPTATVEYPFTQARSLGGPLGAPDPTRGDDGVLIDLATDAPSGCAYAQRSASFATPAMTASLSPVAPANDGHASDAMVAVTGVLAGRVGDALGSRATASIGERTLIGYAPSTALPAFTERLAGLLFTDGPALPGPSLLAVVDCPALPSAILAAARPIALTAFPRIAHVESWNQRRSGPTGPFIRSGITGSATSTTERYALDLLVPLARAPIMLGSIDLSSAADGVTVPVGAGRLAVTYTLELNTTAHYHELALHELENGTSPRLIRRRVYTSATPGFTFDTAVLTPGKEYVFSIHAYHGRPAAALGDFTKVEYPQAATTVFTRTFIAQ